jgi:type III secretion protein V
MLTRYADVALAGLVILIVGMMIVPLPTWLLDVLLASNISLAVLLLLVALYTKNGLAFASFPTILLITTLYRLALNVSSTRLILLQADAGHVISAFGNFVVRGNYVVGAVVFLILTLIQFIVIAKGSERVAEVGARFTLDAMPGKQMSIDAELRSGAISQEEAQVRRRLVQRESEFFGAMDGAMKFVKGDAVAGIVITIINVLGGLVIGVAMRDLEFTASLKTYGLLTIGDGLVSQIPALLISTAAGLVVTRVSSEKTDGTLAGDIAQQIFANPRALTISAVFLVALALTPGLPALPFAVLAAAFFFLARKGVVGSAPEGAGGSAAVVAGPATDRLVVGAPAVVPLAIELGEGLGKRLGGSLDAAIAQGRERIFADLGLPLPKARVRISAELPPNAFAVLVQELPVEHHASATTTTTATAPGVSEIEFVAAALDRAARKRAPEFLGLQETQALLEQLEKSHSALIKNVLPKPVSLALLADILRRLVEEGVSIRPLREILEALALYAPNERDPVTLAELVRTHQRRLVSSRHARGGVLAVYLLAPEIESAVRDAIQRTPNGSYLAMAPDLARDILGAIKRTCVPGPDARPAVFLTQSDVRRFVRRLVETELPEAVVLSYQELAPELIVQPVARVNV